MFFDFRLWIAVLVVCGAAASFVLACDPTNSNNVDCFLPDCEAACRTIGFEGGECEAGACRCTQNGEVFYPWGGEPDGGNGTDTDDGGA